MIACNLVLQGFKLWIQLYSSGRYSQHTFKIYPEFRVLFLVGDFFDNHQQSTATAAERPNQAQSA